jgi:O-antigen/teichoic acid export membrane protein
MGVHSTRVLQILSLGVLANGLAAIPFALIQGTGRADITGKLHLLELPFYLAAVWYLTVHYGIAGTAVAWLLRVVADCILLFLLIASCGLFVVLLVRARSWLRSRRCSVDCRLSCFLRSASLPFSP